MYALRVTKGRLHMTDTLLAAAQDLKDRQPYRVSKRLEQFDFFGIFIHKTPSFNLLNVV